ncbi:hypothetical protein F0P96_03740 [Hymenobacter busanensis]|uniref:Uncharacterized protein n=1 Tax=Hymenobacter busanensis TaxID=2607656 RepID=A0A7L4ZU44_9BACT|nr:hypothetical protein [Hymenobacter busanensis]KAA9339739.1 hypothetical protein F0P96_03740 [Hymenobacter busanensis]QHJ06507.1 hypothetical protein GUY19_04010 [Hymenobacter busanensis]
MADSAQSSGNWADMAASLLSKLSGGVEVGFTFDQMEVQMPAPNAAAAPATWRLNGSVRIRTRGENSAAPQSGPANPAIGG